MTKEYADLNKISQIEIIYRNKVRANDRPRINNPTDAYKLFRQNWNDMTIALYEEFKILLLDRGNKCMGISHISKGGVSGTAVDPKIIFATALKSRASGIILGHNHPSGNLRPSQADINLTKKLKESGNFLELFVFDHLIITQHGFYSFSDEKTFDFSESLRPLTTNDLKL